jgi:hypothetical protein
MDMFFWLMLNCCQFCPEPAAGVVWRNGTGYLIGREKWTNVSEMLKKRKENLWL